jgi:DinB superfamily
MRPITIAPPASDEYAEFHKGYIAAVAGETDGLAVLERQVATIDRLPQITAEQADFRYAEGKWSVKQVIGHLADGERVVSYRLLRIARGDKTPLPGFDENLYVANANANQRPLGDLVADLAAVRAATLTLVRSLDERMLAERGVVNNWGLSARGLVYIIAGHFAHHVNLFRDRYRLPL